MAQDGDGGMSAADTERPNSAGSVYTQRAVCTGCGSYWGVNEAGAKRKIFCPEFPRFVTSFPQK
jgi:hypothetical protein